ncbi:hypothetical protein ACWGHM_40515 [Streptomyces sp. NPDC054904]
MENMNVWLVWLIIALLLGAVEIITLTAALGLLGGAAQITRTRLSTGTTTPID